MKSHGIDHHSSIASAALDTIKNHTLFRQKTRPCRRHIAARVCWTRSNERIAISWRATSCRKRNNNMRAARNRIAEDNIADRVNVATKRQNVLLMPHTARSRPRLLAASILRCNKRHRRTVHTVLPRLLRSSYSS